jgi:3-oxoacyl-[acyl-carrier-protein] synthase II
MNMLLHVVLKYTVNWRWNVSRCTHNRPHPEGLGAKNVMLNCLRDAGLQPTDVDGLNMHGTSTPLGDMAESKAILHVLVNMYTMNLNSTKSMTGHLLGAAGAVETISSILSMKYGIVQPSIM